MNDNGTPNLLLQHDPSIDNMRQVNAPDKLIKTLNLYTGMTYKQVFDDIQEKILVLKWLVTKNITDIDTVGMIMSDYYTEKDYLMGLVKRNQMYDMSERKE